MLIVTRTTGDYYQSAVVLIDETDGRILGELIILSANGGSRGGATQVRIGFNLNNTIKIVRANAQHRPDGPSDGWLARQASKLPSLMPAQPTMPFQPYEPYTPYEPYPGAADAPDGFDDDPDDLDDDLDAGATGPLPVVAQSRQGSGPAIGPVGSPATLPVAATSPAPRMSSSSGRWPLPPQYVIREPVSEPAPSESQAGQTDRMRRAQGGTR